jgi:hypothetical protein
MTRSSWIAIGLVVPAVAQAKGSYIESPADLAADSRVIEVDQGPVFDSSIGFDLGTFHTAQVYNSAAGLDVEAGIRLDRLAILGRYSLLWLSDPNSGSTTDSTGDATGVALTGVGLAMAGTPSGFAHRFGVAARYSVARGLWADHGIAARVELWVEGGLGEQLIRWNAGGYVDRHDVSIAVGSTIGGRGEHHHGGWYLGVRATLAPPPPDAPALTAPPTCAGPCDGPSRPIGIDRSILFVTGASFGS